MSSLSNISGLNASAAASRIGGVIARVGPQGVSPASVGVARADSVSLSPEALQAAEASDTARAERLARIKQEIQSGAYDSADKVAIVADKLARMFGKA
ncbi:MAG: flagellar biosynthesis anti-sigma factor FlgM [Phycisphaerales bacterium]|jgi:anti-sigma28 factor (negative regulator of flagellin synthesis)|nr:flagellar biosynthesis anti-sigma factor FlgM [Phycisphaerales bacterium]